MLKILSIEQIRAADAFTISNEPISSTDLMERASTACADWILSKLDQNQEVKIFCGQGNNGGDGLAIARLLAGLHYKVIVYSILHSDKSSDDFLINMERLIKQNKVEIKYIKASNNLDLINNDEIIIDAMLGSGLSKPVSGLLSECIQFINNAGAVVISIDLPSGLFSDKAIDTQKDLAIKADYCLTFQTPKLAFFFPENEMYVGDWQVLPIGLHPSFLEEQTVSHYLVEQKDVSELINVRKKFGHKGSYGHGLLIAGSYGKMGAAVLSAKAAMRSGAGLITAHIPAKAYDIFQTTFPEAMVSIDSSDYHFSSLPKIEPYNAIAIGPGLGTDPETARALKLLIQNSIKPLILDADALNILAENPTWLHFLPKNSILTPHFKEFERLTNKVSNSFERNKLQREFSIKYGIYITLKGAYSSISFPDGRIFFNSTGNPGMATGGSGDVLTGIMLGLLAQGYSPATVCLMGTYLHGLAGDIAAQNFGQESMLAGDIVDCISEAYKVLTINYNT